MRVQERKIRLRRTGTVPPDSRVKHVDELSDDAREAVYELAGRPRTVPKQGDLDDGDVVKFTDYYVVRAR
ncbi:hypothetical protein JCM17823_25940 [Halorubrum gandharaense]